MEFQSFRSSNHEIQLELGELRELGELSAASLHPYTPNGSVESTPLPESIHRTDEAGPDPLADYAPATADRRAQPRSRCLTAGFPENDQRGWWQPHVPRWPERLTRRS